VVGKLLKPYSCCIARNLHLWVLEELQ